LTIHTEAYGQLRQDYDTFKNKQAEVIVIGPEDNNAFNEFWLKEKMPVPGIADPQHIIAKLYGQEFKILKLGRMSALFVIDREGLVRFRHHGKSMDDIASNKEVLELLDKLNNEIKR
jgi:peroxiredoxin